MATDSKTSRTGMMMFIFSDDELAHTQTLTAPLQRRFWFLFEELLSSRRSESESVSVGAVSASVYQCGSNSCWSNPLNSVIKV